MGVQGVRIGVKALSLFMKAATRLQKCGGETDDDDLWSFAIDSSPNEKDAVSDSALEIVRCLEAVEDVLYDLLDSCERKLSMVKAASRRRSSGHGIQDLPDEVLSNIFESVVKGNSVSGPPSSPEMVLTHVCSRFRSVALNTPVLWAYIASTVSSNEALAHLELSGNYLLTIVIDEDWWSEEVQRFLSLVVPHAHRWKTFDSNLCRFKPTGSLEVILNDPQPPQLETLYVRSDCFEFLRNWNTPKLCCVRMSAADPWAPPRIPLAPAVFSSQALWYLDFDEITFSLEVVDYLTSAPNLTELRITTSHTLRLDVSGIYGVLPKLRKMTLRTDEETVLLALIFCMEMPELSVLDLDVDLCAESALDVCNIHGTLPRLRKMTLRTNNKTVLLALIFRLEMPELSDLDLDLTFYTGLALDDFSICSTLPKLRKMTLRTNDKMALLALIFRSEMPELSVLDLHVNLRAESALDVCNIHGTLPKLRDMTLETNDKTVLVALIGRLRMPELSILDLHIRCRHVWDTKQIESFETYPSVNELNISYYYKVVEECFEDTTEYTVEMDLPPLFVLFPEMERLNSLNSSSNFFELEEDEKFLPPLLSISALVCQEDSSFLRNLVEGLKLHGRWEQFEFFRLKPEGAISWDEASDIFTEEKLGWYE